MLCLVVLLAVLLLVGAGAFGFWLGLAFGRLQASSPCTPPTTTVAASPPAAMTVEPPPDPPAGAYMMGGATAITTKRKNGKIKKFFSLGGKSHKIHSDRACHVIAERNSAADF
jgi:hypothetical protein